MDFELGSTVWTGMPLDPKSAAVLEDALRECGFSMPIHQLKTLEDFNAQLEKKWAALVVRLRVDGQSMDDIHDQALNEDLNRLGRMPVIYERPGGEEQNDYRPSWHIEVGSIPLGMEHAAVTLSGEEGREGFRLAAQMYMYDWKHRKS